MAVRRRFPHALLQHKVTVLPYLGWARWGTPTIIRCLVDYEPGAPFDAAGHTVRRGARIFAPLAAVCPPGSKVTLPDGSTGYASSAVQKQGGGLPVPEHWEITVDVGIVVGPPAGETVILLQRVDTGRLDRLRNPVYAVNQIPVPGCLVTPGSSSEVADGSRDTVTSTVEVVMPPATPVAATDRLRVRGLLYVIEGRPTDESDSMLGTDAGIRVTARRVTG